MPQARGRALTCAVHAAEVLDDGRDGAAVPPARGHMEPATEGLILTTSLQSLSSDPAWLGC